MICFGYWKAGREGSVFPLNLPTYARTIWLRMTKCGICRGGACHAVFQADEDPAIFATSCRHPHGMTHSNLIFDGDETRWEENVYRLATPKALDETVCDTNTDKQSVCRSQPRCYAVCLVCEWWYVGRTVSQQVTWRFVADAYTSGVWRGQRSQVPAFT